jgi:hypothetical protein
MRLMILSALASLALLGCSPRRTSEPPPPKVGTSSTHFGQSQATLNTAPGLDAFGAGTGGSGPAQPRASKTKRSGKGAGWNPTVSTNGVGRTSLADQRLVGQHTGSAQAASGEGLRPTGQGAEVHFDGVGAQMGISPDRPGVVGGEGINGER